MEYFVYGGVFCFNITGAPGRLLCLFYRFDLIVTLLSSE